MWLTGYKYVSMENLKRFCRHPVTVLIIMLTVLLVMLLMLIDFCAVIYILHAGYHGTTQLSAIYRPAVNSQIDTKASVSQI